MELLKINSVLPFRLTKKRVNYKDQYQLKHLKQYANIFYYKKYLCFALNKIIQKNQIKFDCIFSDTTIKELKRSYGKPLYHVNHYHKNYHVEIVYFKKLIDDKKVRLEFHFCDKQLFYYTYTFPYLSNSEKDNLFKNIEEKYNLKYSEIIDNCIIDSELKAMSVSDGIDLKVGYANRQSEFFKYINNRFTKNSTTDSEIRTSTFRQLNNLL